MKTDPFKDDPLYIRLRKRQQWEKIHKMAETDPALQDILERAIIYYNLKKPNGEN